MKIILTKETSKKTIAIIGTFYRLAVPMQKFCCDKISSLFINKLINLQGSIDKPCFGMWLPSEEDEGKGNRCWYGLKRCPFCEKTMKPVIID